MEIVIDIEDVPFVFEQMRAHELGYIDPNGICNAIWIPLEEW